MLERSVVPTLEHRIVPTLERRIVPTLEHRASFPRWSVGTIGLPAMIGP
jgi:hypothetical protein